MEGLSNEELRKLLIASGIKDPVVTDSTRGIYLRRLQKLKGVELNSHSDTFRDAPAEAPAEENGSPGAEVRDEKTPVEGFYGICMSKDCEAPDKALLSPCYYSKAEALRAIKNCPGARFKRFDSQSAAEAFASSPLSLTPRTPQTPQVSEKPNSLPKLKQQDLAELKNLIDAGDADGFAEKVWSNPRYLITSGDTPEILHVALRHNALHCAVVANQLQVCQQLVDIIQSDHFWQMVYPDDTEEIRAKRCSHLLDLYLNLPVAKGYFNDTPLHLASKLGHKEIVKFLIALPGMRVDTRNREGKMAAEVVCERTTNKGQKDSIRELFEEIHYVSVIRAVDNSTPPYLHSSLNASSPEHFFQVHDDSIKQAIAGPMSPVKVNSIKQAIAGPMSPVKAEEFYHKWKSPSKTKRADAERGMERVGRDIAHGMRITWSEYWDFLGCYCDLSQPESLERLEQYLAQLSEEIRSLHCQPRISMTPSCSQSDRHGDMLRSLEPDTNRNISIVIDDDDEGGRKPYASSHVQLSVHPVSMFNSVSGEENLQESEESPLPSSITSPRPPPSSPYSPAQDGVRTSGEAREGCSGNGVVSEALLDALQKLEISSVIARESTSEHGFHTPPNEYIAPPLQGAILPVYLTGAEPTKLDLDVLLALCNVEIDAERYPCVYRWRQLVESHSKEEQSRWHTPRASQPTPKLHRGVKQPLSPLVLASPPSVPFSPSSPSSFRTMQTGSLPTTPLGRRAGMNAVAAAPGLAFSEARIPREGQARLGFPRSSGLRVSLFSSSNDT